MITHPRPFFLRELLNFRNLQRVYTIHQSQLHRTRQSLYLTHIYQRNRSVRIIIRSIIIHIRPTNIYQILGNRFIARKKMFHYILIRKSSSHDSCRRRNIIPAIFSQIVCNFHRPHITSIAQDKIEHGIGYRQRDFIDIHRLSFIIAKRSCRAISRQIGFYMKRIPPVGMRPQNQSETRCRIERSHIIANRRHGFDRCRIPVFIRLHNRALYRPIPKRQFFKSRHCIITIDIKQ